MTWSPAARRWVVGGAIALLMALMLQAHAAAEPSPVTDCDVPIVADDGIVLRANVVRPSAEGRLPTMLTATPYGKGDCSGSPEVDAATFLDAGYAVVTVESRGTGSSQGVIDGWGQRDVQDYMSVLDWIQAQPWSDGQVVTTGCSAGGQNALLFAIADAERVQAGKDRAVVATWADSSFADTLRDGWIGPGGATPWKGTLLAGAVFGNVPHQVSFDPLETEPGHPGPALEWLTGYYGSWLGRVYTDREIDGPSAFYGPEADARNLELSASSIRIPIVLTVSWDDATTLASAQTRFFGHLVNSPKRVLFASPGPHCGTTEWDKLGFGASQTDVKLAWFDRWVKDTPNGIDQIPNVNLYPTNATEWLHGSAFPLAETRWVDHYLDGGANGTVVTEGTLRTSRPDSTGVDLLVNTFKVGAPAKGLGPRPDFPAAAEDTAMLRYTSEPLSEATLLAGPITAEIYAAFDRAEGALAVAIWDVAPDGTRRYVTVGHLRATNRAVDPSRSEYGPGGIVVRPYHPLTMDARQEVVGTNSYLIEVETTAYLFPAEHQIMVTVGFAEPQTELPAILAIEIAGETMQVNRGGEQASWIRLPFVAAGAAQTTDPNSGEDAQGSPDSPQSEVDAAPPLPATGTRSGAAAVGAIALGMGLAGARRRHSRAPA